jgi:hypothetical protein
VRKYDQRGQVALQFGEQKKQPSIAVKRLLTSRYKHRWGRAYRFDLAKILGLWTDGKGRVYLLTEHHILHVFASDGKPLAVFDFAPDDKVTFAGDRGSLGSGVASSSTPMFVDSDGHIYTNTWAREKITGALVGGCRLKVWAWEPEVREVFGAWVPEAGVAVGKDASDNIYYSSAERVYKLSRNQPPRVVFEPKRFYESWIRAERKSWIASLPQELRRYYEDRGDLKSNWNNGPHVGHIAHVDKEGNLYVTLVGAKDFRIDRIAVK